jgi:hypothetical protein
MEKTKVRGQWCFEKGHALEIQETDKGKRRNSGRRSRWLISTERIKARGQRCSGKGHAFETQWKTRDEMSLKEGADI